MKLGHSSNKETKLCYSAHLIDGVLKFGRLRQMACEVKYHIYKPTLELYTNKPSVPYFAVVSVGVHTHPAPPPAKIPINVRDKLIDAIKTFGASTATATRMLASNMLPLLMDNKVSLSMEHVSLLNYGRINQIIRRERLKENQCGSDFMGTYSSYLNLPIYTNS